MKKKSLSKNAILNALRTTLGIIFPLISFPYVSRILGVDNIGRFHFSYSIVTYAAVFAALGVHTYSIRECAKVRDDKMKLEKMASEIFSINLVAAIITYIILIVLCFIVPKFAANRALIYVLSLEIIFTTVGCEWIYPVFEDYLYITLRTLGVYVLSMALLFAFVRTEQDLLKYAIVSSVSVCGAGLANLIGRRKLCRIRPTIHLNLKQHLTPILTIFMNTVTTTIYVNSDMLILGLMTSDTYTGLYTVSVRIYTIIKRILAAVITVSVPRLARYWGAGDQVRLKETCHKIFNVLLIVVTPAMVGLFAISKQVVLLIAGKSFADSRQSLQILSIALLLSLFCWFFTSCILIPSKNEKKVLQGTIAAALSNIILNLVLIPYFQERAAALTTCIAEAVALGFGYFRSRKILRIHLNLRDVLSVIAGCALIFIICFITNFTIGERTILTLAISIPASVIGYVGALMLGKNKYAFEMLHTMIRKIKR